MDDWKELDIANLPPDILVGDYEFETYISEGPGWQPSSLHIAEWIDDIQNGRKYRLRYRKRAPKAPTHEEIMTKWWKWSDNAWFKVIAYYGSFYYFKDFTGSSPFDGVKKDWFTGRESADIPPE